MKTLLLLVIGFTASFSFGQLAYVGSSTENQLFVVDLNTQTVLSTIPTGGNPSMGAFTSDFSKFYVPVYETGVVLEINPYTHTITDTIPVGLNPTQLILNHDNTLAYVCAQGSNSVSVIDVASNTVFFSFSTGLYPNQMALSADETMLYVTNVFDYEIGVYSTNTYIEITTIPTPDFPIGIRISPDGSQLYCSLQNNNTGELAIIETSTYSIDTLITVGNYPHDVMVNSQGTQVYVTCLDDNKVVAVDLNSYQLTNTGVGQYPTCLEFDLTEDYYYTTNTNGGTVTKIDAATNLAVTSFPVGTNPYGISVFPHNLGLSEGSSNEISVYPNPSNGSFSVQLPANNGKEQLLQLQTLDGKTIASYTINQAIFQLNELVANGSYILRVEGERGASSVIVQVNK